VIDAIRGLGSALHTVAAVGLMIDPRDLGRTLVDGVESDTATRAQLSDDLTFDPTLYLYDQFAGGVGLAPRLFEEREALLQRARRLLVHCDCGDGCPACVGPSVGVDDPTLGRWSRKALSLDVLGALGVGEG
jgi:DEAD/DEAH box helicase domain-containing protein